MVFVDYVFNVVRSVSDLINLLAYIFLWVFLVLLAFYINSKEEYDAKINNIILIWFENNWKIMNYVFLQVPREKWVFRSYEMGRFNFLFSSGRLPYFLFITKMYSTIAQIGYNKITKKIREFFSSKK